MNIQKMSEEGAVQTVNEVCDGLKEFFIHNPEQAKEFLVQLMQETLDPLSDDDFFGTEGWEHGLGVER